MRDFSNVRNDNFIVDLSRNEQLMTRMREATELNTTICKAGATLLYSHTYEKAKTCRVAHRLLIDIADTLKTRIELPDGAFAGPAPYVPQGRYIPAAAAA